VKPPQSFLDRQPIETSQPDKIYGKCGFLPQVLTVPWRASIVSPSLASATSVAAWVLIIILSNIGPFFTFWFAAWFADPPRPAMMKLDSNRQALLSTTHSHHRL
jgi:hypothetical protein